MGKIKAGVVVVTEFCKPSNQMFQGYIDYIDRDEAVRNEHIDEYNIYQDYMGNPYKTTGLFTQEKSRLEEEEKRELKNAFSMAQDNKSLMWQTVISFDNEWLCKQGLWNGYLSIQNEQKLQTIIRKSVNEMLEKENLQNAVWSAAFHLNTDNLHVHIAIVEPVPMRERKSYPVYKEYKKNGKMEQIQVGTKMEYKGRFKLSSIEACKRVVVNEITNQREQNLEINRVIRESIVQKKRETLLRQDEDLKKAFFSLYEKMPDCKRSLWNYNSSKMAHLKGEIDGLSHSYIEKYHKKDYKELKDKLIKQDEMYREAYGKSESSYLNGKIEDLYTRLGNAILKEIKEYDKNRTVMATSLQDKKEKMTYLKERENVVESEEQKIEDESILEKTQDVNFEYEEPRKFYRKDVSEYEKQKNEQNTQEGNKKIIHEQTKEDKGFKETRDPLKNSTDDEKKYEQGDLNGMNNWKYNSMKRQKFYNSQKAINGLKRALDNSYESYKNQKEYEKVLEEQRRERNSQKEISI